MAPSPSAGPSYLSTPPVRSAPESALSCCRSALNAPWPGPTWEHMPAEQMTVELVQKLYAEQHSPAGH